MESCSDGKKKMTKESNHSESHNSHKGGIRAILFIIGSAVIVALATNGPRPNLIIYLMKEYHMEMAKGSNMVFFWTAATYFTPLLAAIVADTFTGRFWMSGSGIVIAFLGMTLLWQTTMIPQARPSPCNIESTINCESATKFQLFLLWASLGLTSLGSGFAATLLSFGADQLLIKQKDEKVSSENNDNDNNHIIKRYINWFYACSSFSVFVAYSLLVYIQDNVGWKVGFGIPVGLLFFSFLIFFSPSTLYVKLKAKSGWATELVQVVVAAYRKRSIDLSSSSQNYSYHRKEGSSLVVPTQKLRFFNRACIITRPNDQELQENGKTSSSSHHDPWSLCTVDQVEDLKSVIKVIPIWFIGMLMEISVTQITILTLQAKSMNRKLGSHFEIPAGSFSMFAMLSLALWVPLYNYIFLPIVSRIKGKPVYLGMKLRMGVGIFLACLCLVVNGITENIRRRHATTGRRLSAMCLLPQLILGGFTESMFATAQYEFFYLELPRNMASTSSILFQVEYSVANLLSSLVMSIADDLSQKGGKESWISSDINKGRYDYFYWVISGFCLVDLVLYMIWSKLYGPCKGEVRQITVEIHEEQRIPV